MTTKNYKDRAFEVMGLYALRNYAEQKFRWLTGSNNEDNIDENYGDWYGYSELKVPFWKKVFWVFKDNRSLRDQVTKLQRDLLVYKQLAQDTGRVGLNLFSENEALHKLIGDLRRQIDNPVEYKDGILFWKDACDRAGTQLKEIEENHKKLEYAYKRLETVINDDIREKLSKI